MKRLLICLILSILPLNLWAAYLYVDPGDHESGVTWDDTDGHSYTSSAGGFPGTGTGYNTIQAAINACSVGDTIYMRGGTYDEINLLISPATKSGTAWTAGNYTTLCSYPGEWAVIDGGNDNDDSTGPCSELNQAFNEVELHYWVFERFEVTGMENGIWLTGGPFKFRYLYIHDNKANADEDYRAGLWVSTMHDSVIEYCYFKDNEATPKSANNANIMIKGDYKTGAGEGSAFDEAYCNRKNIIRYNYISGSYEGYRDKGDQRFGVNSRNPNPLSGGGLSNYSDWGNDIHHNIVVGVPLIASQDLAQVHHNIVDGSYIDLNRRTNMTRIYSQVAYNNTVIGTTAQLCWWSNRINHDFTGLYDYYDVGEQGTVHPWVWMWNNIVDGTTVSAVDDIYPYLIAHEGSVTTNPDFSGANTTFDRNLMRNNSSATVDVKIWTDAASDYTMAEVDDAIDTWLSRAGGTTKNWDNDSGTLWTGESGASKYIPNGSFVAGDTTYTIASGGIGGNHPYLSGVTIPSYVGAVNPSDDDWVAGVLALDATYFTNQTAGSTPTWIEGSETPAASTTMMSNGTTLGTGSTVRP